MAQFRLDRIRFTWKGTWAGSTTYTKDDIVRYDGKSYVCLVGHTSTSPTQTLTVSSATASGGTAVLTFTATQTIPTAPFLVGQTITVSGFTQTAFNGTFIVTTCAITTINNVSTTTVSYNLAGTYTGASGSVTGPAVATVWNGVSYSGFYADLNTINTQVLPNVPNPYWQLWFDGYSWQGNWQPNTAYSLGMIVRYNSLIYICNYPHTSVNLSNPIVPTGVSGNGTNVTMTFANQILQPYLVGSTITIAGMAPNSYNGTYTVLNCSSSSVTFANSSVSALTTIGTITGTSQVGLEYNQPYWTVYASTDNWTGGNWTNNTTYRLNDIVKYGGTEYRCTVAHVSAPAIAYINVTTVSTFSGSVTLSFQSQAIAPFIVGSTITVAGVSVSGYNGSYVVTACTTSSVTYVNSTTGAANGGTITGTSQLALEANQSSWVTLVYTDKWTTDWTVSTHYKLDDIVRYGGIVYRCIAAHLSASTIALGLENDINSWQVVAQGVDYKSSWSGSFRYKIQDVVKYGANAYVCTTYHTSGILFDASKWSIYAPGLEYRNPWDVNTRYAPGDIVKYGGYSYYSNTNNTAQVPSTDATDWTLVTFGYTINGDFSLTTQYYVGNVVRRDGQVYVCLADNIGNDPNTSASYWQLIVSGSYWLNKWILGTVYVIGDTVTYYATSYRCIQGHTANSFNNPQLDVSNTYWAVYIQGDHLEVMTNQGDITTYVANAPTALPIGTVGQVLKSTGTQIQWSTFGYINNVYYVSNTNGIDAPNYGTSLNAPFATIAYACKVVQSGAYYQNAATLITINKQWIIAEMYNWMTYQSTNSNSPFSPGAVYDPNKTQRDAEYIIDGVIYDMTRGGNSQSVASAYSFFQPGTNNFYNSNVAGEITYFIAAINQLLSLMQNAIAQSAPSQNYQALTGASSAVVSITGGSATGSLITLTFAQQSRVPFVAGETITVANVNPVSYNGTFIVTAVSSTSVSYVSTTTATYINGGTIAGSAITQTYSGQIAAESGSNTLVSSLIGIITSALTNQSTAVIPPTNTGVTSTIFIKDGTYNEILPITVPENTAIVGDELRNTIVQPSPINTSFTGTIAGSQLTVSGVSSINITGFTVNNGIATATYASQTSAPYVVGSSITLSGFVPLVTSTSANVNATFTVLTCTQTQLTFALLGTYTVSTLGVSTGGIAIGMWISAAAVLYPTQISAQVSGTPGGLGVYTVSYSQTVATSTMVGGYTTANMFYCRNGSGIRNMTLYGLAGGLGPLNTYLTQRPTAGAYVSLDPGKGPYDTSAWIFRKSPYIQNVTTFGSGCVGLKIDGSLHAGGNKSIVANDFTQVLSDGIGCWCTGPGSLTELVSVFSYYCHAGYLAELGGKIRATNGNSSYGKYGVVAETFDITEVPISASVNNRFFQAQVYSAFAGQAQNKILKLEFSNCGQNYSSATYTFAGAGLYASVIADEFRDYGIFETHLTGSSLGLGGSGYLTAGNQSSGGNTTSIYLATSDTNTALNYVGLRLVIISGTGVGQYGYIQAYNASTKLATIYTESTNQNGWDHIIAGTPIVSTLDTTTQYQIEPRLTFSSPGFTATARTIAVNNWISVAYGNNLYFALDNAGLTATSTNGTSWTSSTALSAGTWTACAYGNNIFVFVGTTTSAAYYSSGTYGSSSMPTSASWSAVTYNSIAGQFLAIATYGLTTATSSNGSSWSPAGSLVGPAAWSGVAWGSGPGVYVAVSGYSVGTGSILASNISAYSTNGATWVGTTMPSSAYWSSVAYGNGRFVSVDAGNVGTATTTKAAYSLDGITWYASTLPQAGNWVSVSYGQGLFIATGLSSSVCLTSQDGLNWTVRTLPGSTQAYNAVVFGNPTVTGNITPTWVTVAGNNVGVAVSIATGATAFARATISSGGIGVIKMQEPGSGYLATPTLTIYDPNVVSGTLAQGTTTFTVSGTSIASAGSYSNVTQLTTSGVGSGAVFTINKTGSGTTYTSLNTTVSITTAGSNYAVGDTITIPGTSLGGGGGNNLILVVGTATGTQGTFATTLCRTGTGVLANPSFVNRGTGYQTSTTTVTVSGNGFADILQGPQNLICSGITVAPTPGANLVIAGSAVQYNIVLITQLSTNIYQFQLSINLDNSLQPAHGTSVTIRVKYSQVRLTGHDFLYIGTGNFGTTNYPNVDISTALQNQQIQYNGGGRVFVVSTDQDGNFKVGNLFGVQQATGTVTISASLFNLNGITSLAIGGFSVGTNAVIINQFSTDSYFTANSDTIIPTQKAIKSYMSRAIAAGGSNAFTSLLTAGTVAVGLSNGQNEIFSTTGAAVKISNKAYFPQAGAGSQGVDGSMIAQIFFNNSNSGLL